MPAAFFRRIHWATAKPKRKEEIAQHKRHYRTLHCCGAVQLAVCGRVLLRGPSQRVCVVRQHDERHEHLCAADHRRDDEVRAVPEESVRVSAHARVRVCPLAQMVSEGARLGPWRWGLMGGEHRPQHSREHEQGRSPHSHTSVGTLLGSSVRFGCCTQRAEVASPCEGGMRRFAALDVLRIPRPKSIGSIYCQAPLVRSRTDPPSRLSQQH
jgi:hypothetical protein